MDRDKIRFINGGPDKSKRDSAKIALEQFPKDFPEADSVMIIGLVDDRPVLMTSSASLYEKLFMLKFLDSYLTNNYFGYYEC